MAHTRPFEFPDLMPLAQALRQADKDEIYASLGVTPEVGLMMSVKASKYTKVIITDEPVGIFGLSGKVTLGMPWMLATDNIKDCQIQFLKECRNYIDEMLTHAPILANFVDERNTLHRKWLEWCGFVPFKRIEGFGYEERPFIEYVRI